MTAKQDNQIELFSAKNGSITLKVKAEDGAMRALHSLYDPEGEAEIIVNSFTYDGKGILVVLGLGLGYHIPHLLSRYPEAHIVVIESNSEIHELAKEHGKLDEFSHKITLITGVSQREAISKITDLQVKSGMPPLSFFSLPSATAAFPSYYKPIFTALQNAASVKLWERLRYKKFNSERIKVLLIDHGYFLTRELETAIRTLGHEVERVEYGKSDDGNAIVTRMLKKIVEFKPDFFLTVNHLGFDEEGALTSFLESIEMLVASWYVDSPNIIVRGFSKNVSPLIALFLWDRSYQQDMERMGFSDITYLPLGTDETVFKKLSLKSAEVRKYGSEVAFVGNSMVTPLRERLDEVHTSLHKLIAEIAQELSSLRIHLDELLEKYEDRIKEIRTLAEQERLEFERAVLWNATMLYRQSCIQTLEPFHPVIYGDPGWKKLLGPAFTLKSPLHYYKELPLVYNATAINFNATSLQMLGAVNQRVFDVPACGAFLLTDHQESIEALFEVGSEVVTYKDKSEIPELVKFYLKNPGLREEVARKGRERVLRDHTYGQRLSTIIHTMKSRYGGVIKSGGK